MSELNQDPFPQEQPQTGIPEGAANQTPGTPPDPKAAAQPPVDPELQSLKDQFKKEIESAQYHARRYQSMADKAASVFGGEQAQPQAPTTPEAVAYESAYKALRQRGIADKDAQDLAMAQAQSVQAALAPILTQLQATQATQALPMAIQQAAVDPVVQLVLNDPQAYQHMNQIIQSNTSQGFAPTKEMVQNAAYMAWGPRYAQQGAAPQQQAPVAQPFSFPGTTIGAPGSFQIRPPSQAAAQQQLTPGQQTAQSQFDQFFKAQEARHPNLKR